MDKIFDGVVSMISFCDEVVSMKDIERYIKNYYIKNYEALSKEELLILVKDTLIVLNIALVGYEKVLYLACCELEDKDSILFDLYDRLDTYYESKDRHEWKEYLLESVKDDE